VHMGRMTQSLLAYTQLEDRSPTMVPVDCQAVLADAVQLLHEDIREIGAQVLAGRLPTVNGDSGQLVQLFFNLIDNALKYRSDSPLIEVAALRRDGGWLFSVSDNGIGIAPQYLDRIFDTFKRVHSQREYPGKGIGLALCRRVIESHGGTIWATSEPGRGSTFWFTLAGAEGGNPHN
jgi:light-regulated signal transduction histidine kinase (bacteriophytochrome)